MLQKKANVGVSTVSRVINNHPEVSKKTRELVNKTIKELNFIPNPLAKGLNKAETKIVAVIMPLVTNNFYSMLLEGIEKKAASYGYKILFCNTGDDNAQIEKEYLSVFKQYKVDGLLIASNFTLLDELINLNLPTVTIDQILHEKFPSVSSDNINGGKIVAKAMIKGGSKNILLFRGASFLMTTKERTFGINEILNKHKLVADIYDFDLTNPDLDLIRKIILSKPNVDGIICLSDNLAMATNSVCQELGYKIPDDIQITGYDNITLSKWMTPSLSTVNQNVSYMGKIAFQMLYKLMNDKPLEQKNYVDEVKFIKRNSTK